MSPKVRTPRLPIGKLYDVKHREYARFTFFMAGLITYSQSVILWRVRYFLSKGEKNVVR